MAFWTGWNHCSNLRVLSHPLDTPTLEHMIFISVFLFYSSFFFFSPLALQRYCDISAVHSVLTTTLQLLGIKSPTKLLRLPKWQLERKIICRKIELCCIFSSHLLQSKFSVSNCPGDTCAHMHWGIYQGIQGRKVGWGRKHFILTNLLLYWRCFLPTGIKYLFIFFFIAGTLRTISVITITLTGVLELE